MPSALITTNAVLTNELSTTICKEISSLLAQQLNKPEKYVMVSIQHIFLTMGGTLDTAAFMDIRSIGGLTETANILISKDLCASLAKQLEIAPTRIYLTFSNFNATHFGWNGTTFA